MTDPTGLNIANASGFPLQIAVEHLVRCTESVHHWRVDHREHAWAFEGESGFIDLVLTDEYGSSTLVVECKRVREGAWVFLPASGSAAPRRHVNVWVAWYNGATHSPFGWHDVAAGPESPEATFCAIKGQDGSGQRSLLERVGGELILSTEALANERRDFRPSERLTHIQVYTSVIVTTAALKVASFKPEDISLEDGTLPEGKAQFEDVPFLRFRKQLTAREQRLGPKDHENRHAVRARENTVFVVNANALVQFLKCYELDDEPLRRLCRP